jgi:hypothetical protein
MDRIITFAAMFNRPVTGLARPEWLRLCSRAVSHSWSVLLMLRKVFYQAAASHPSEGQQLSLVGGFLKYCPLLPLAPGAGERIASGSGLGATASSSGAFPCAPIARLSPVVPALGLASGFVLPPRPNGQTQRTSNGNLFQHPPSVGNVGGKFLNGRVSGQMGQPRAASRESC